MNKIKYNSSVKIHKTMLSQETENCSFQMLSNALRFLSVDMVENAQSGHPGLALGMADVVTVLFQHFFKASSHNIFWNNRDRLIFSAGHGSPLLYSLLYLIGTEDYSIKELKNFRKFGSLTAGHPEKNESGVDLTTGPLGQGLAMAVGIAIAERVLNARIKKFINDTSNKETKDLKEDSILNHKTYVIASDGDMMEGISQEAISMAGHLNLHNLIVLYDDNGITIDGPTTLSFSDDTKKRFEACHFDCMIISGHDEQQIYEALSKAQLATRPTLIICKTIIGKGAPTKQGSSKCHGTPLGSDEIKKMRESLNWTSAPFEIPDFVLNKWRSFLKIHEEEAQEWHEKYFDLFFNRSHKKFNFSKQFDCTLAIVALEEIAKFEKVKQNSNTKRSTRQMFNDILEKIAPHSQFFIGGSADLTPSNSTKTKMNRVISKDDYSGDYIHFGVREHAMAAIMNGITLHQKDFLRPFGGTFLAFSDYMRPAIRLSALMNLPVLYIFTHDSIWLGEDGPTHQPVEHLASLRSIPNLFVMRPCNPLELSLCLSEAIKQSNPTALVLTRQEIEVHDISGDDDKSSDFISGYLYAGSGTPDVTIVATGSEVSIALKVRRHLQDIYKISTNVISIPCMELFLKKDQTSIDDLLKHNKRLVFIEAALSLYSNRIVNSKTMFFGVNQFGGSGHLKELIDVFEFDDKVIADKIARNI